MEKRMTFDIDCTSVTEGDIVEVRWDCTGADRVELNIDNGFKSSVIPLEISGTKRFRLNRSKGRTALTITAWKEGKSGSKTLKVKVKELPTTHAETVDNHGREMGSLRQWWHKMQPRWQSLSADKRLALCTLLSLTAILLITALLPAFLIIGVSALMLYLFYIVCKK